MYASTTGQFHIHTEGLSFLSTEARSPLQPGLWERLVLAVSAKMRCFFPIILTTQFAVDPTNCADSQEPLEREEDDRHEYEPEQRKPESVFFRKQKRTHSRGHELK